MTDQPYGYSAAAFARRVVNDAARTLLAIATYYLFALQIPEPAAVVGAIVLWTTNAIPQR